MTTPLSLTTYRKLCSEFYDLDKPPRADEAFSFYLRKACEIGGSMLEPMCGSGRILLPFLQKGFDIEGFDASSYMLDALRKKYQQSQGDEPPVWVDFIQSFKSEKLYNFILIPYGSFGLIIRQDDRQRSLKRLYDHLLPGGTLLLEIETIASVPHPCRVWRRGVHTRADGSQIALHFYPDYYHEKQLFQSFCRYELCINGVVQHIEEELFEQYLYAFGQLEIELESFGYSDIRVYAAFDEQKKVDEHTPIIIYECKK